jgi:hypothetical protein
MDYDDPWSERLLSPAIFVLKKSRSTAESQHLRRNRIKVTIRSILHKIK